MTTEEIMQLLADTGALLHGHFLLTSGKHSAQYVQCAQVMQYPDKARRLGQELATAYAHAGAEVVIGPAMGGIHLAHEVAYALGTRSLFTERVDGKMALRRNFKLAPGEKVLIVEDVITTGGSVREVVELIRSLGGNPIGVGCLVDRTTGTGTPAEVSSTTPAPTSSIVFPTKGGDLPLVSLLRLQIVAYDPVTCPLCAQGLPWEKPGSRKQG